MDAKIFDVAKIVRAIKSKYRAILSWNWCRIFIWSSLVLSGLSFFWEFSRRHPGLIVVLASVAIEVILDWRDEAGHRLKKFAMVALVAGLAYELIEAHEADKAVSDAYERTSTNELAAKQLDKQLTETKTQLAKAEARLIELRNESLPMDIGEQVSLANSLKPIIGIQVKLRFAIDAKAQRTSEMLSSTFALAGWEVIDRRAVGDIGEEGVIIGYNGDEASQKASSLLLKLLTERGVPSKIFRPMLTRGVPTNAIIVAVMQRPSALKAELMIAEAHSTIAHDEEMAARLQFGLAQQRMNELLQKKFLTNSIELAQAQAEFNDLQKKSSESYLKMNDFSKKQDAISKITSELWSKLEEQEKGTNVDGPGVHMYGTRVFGGNPAIVVGTNATVVFHGSSFNAPPLE